MRDMDSMGLDMERGCMAFEKPVGKMFDGRAFQAKGADRTLVVPVHCTGGTKPVSISDRVERRLSDVLP